MQAALLPGDSLASNGVATQEAPAASSSGGVQARAQRKAGMGVCGLVVIGFFWVSGGIYGNEALVCAAPPAYIFLFLLVTPVVFSLPIALITAELATTFPADGGQVMWAAMACGPIVGRHNAYWVWLTNVIDASVYPQLVLMYLRKSLGLTSVSEAAVSLSMVWFATAVSLLGVRWIERSQTVIFIVSMVPCMLFIGFGLPHLSIEHLTITEGDVDWSLLLSWILWLYSGISSLGSLAGEVEKPRSAYPQAIAVLLPMIMALNLAPFAVSISMSPERANYERSGYFRTLAGEMAGPWLQYVYAVGAVVVLFGLFHSQQLVADCTLYAFSDVPSMETSGVPCVVVLANAVVVSGFVLMVPYKTLVELEMSLYCSSQLVFFYSFVALRVQQPLAPRPFHVPGGVRVAIALVVLPVGVVMATLGANMIRPHGVYQYGAAISLGLGAHAASKLVGWRSVRSRQLEDAAGIPLHGVEPLIAGAQTSLSGAPST